MNTNKGRNTRSTYSKSQAEAYLRRINDLELPDGIASVEVVLKPTPPPRPAPAASSAEMTADAFAIRRVVSIIMLATVLAAIFIRPPVGDMRHYAQLAAEIIMTFACVAAWFDVWLVVDLFAVFMAGYAVGVVSPLIRILATHSLGHPIASNFFNDTADFIKNLFLLFVIVVPPLVTYAGVKLLLLFVAYQ